MRDDLKTPKQRKQIRLSKSQLDFIDGLERLRVYGDNVSEIVRRFVDEGIEKLAKESTIQKILEARDTLAKSKRESIKPIIKKSGTS